LDAFSIIDGTVTKDCTIVSSVITNPTDDLVKVMDVASKFSSSSMQEKFDYMSDVTFINHRRLKDAPEFIKVLK
jgi:hypothetical protein